MWLPVDDLSLLIAFGSTLVAAGEGEKVGEVRVEGDVRANVMHSVLTVEDILLVKCH